MMFTITRSPRRAASVVVVEEPARGEIGEEQPGVGPGRGDQRGHELAPLVRAQVHLDRALALVQARPEEALAVAPSPASGRGRGRRRSGRSGSRPRRAAPSPSRRAGAATNADPSTIAHAVQDACHASSSSPRRRAPGSSSPVPVRGRLRPRAPPTRAPCSAASPPPPSRGSIPSTRSSVRSTSPSNTGREVVAALPRHDRRDAPGSPGWRVPRPRRSCARRRRAAGRASCRVASVCAIATFSVSRASSGCAGHGLAGLHDERLRRPPSVLVMGAGRGLAQGREVPARRHGALDRGRVQRPRDVVEAVGVPGVRLGVAQRDHRAAPEVEQRLAVGVGGPDPQRHQSRGRPWPAPVLLQAHHLGAGAQRLARRTPAARARGRGRRGCRARAASGRWTGRWPRRRRGWGGRAAARRGA